MKVYITPAGKTALLASNFLERAREEFGFDIVILLADVNLANDLYNKFYRENLIVVPVSNPFFGNTDYLRTVRRIVKKVLLFCPEAEQIIINSSGGTEKMTSIIKDASDILSKKYPILRSWGVHDTISGEVIFTLKPDINPEKELEDLEESVGNNDAPNMEDR